MIVIDDHLIPSCGGSSEASVFYYKMKADYYRYMAEFKSGNDKKEAATSTAEAELVPTHPIRLGLPLNFSVACHLAKQAFDEAISELDTLNEEKTTHYYATFKGQSNLVDFWHWRR
ncbi:LOW QUALITY PROTEIN: hypothetical protein M8C21_030939, partial [Ambrosia artemisiifolia]